MHTGFGGVGVMGMRSGGSSGGGVYGSFENSTTGSGFGVGGATFSSSSSSYGIYGQAPSAAYAGYFSGRVHVTGNLSKGAGSFKIDHPLDPENKYLYHSFVESPDMKNIYDGIVTLDENGEARVSMPDWFDALNFGFRYQLTCVGDYAPVYIAEEIEKGQFLIGGGKPQMKVSWQVTGIRQDAFANANRIPIEEDKPVDERGRYLHPEAFGQPKSLGVHHELLEQARGDSAALQDSSPDQD